VSNPLDKLEPSDNPLDALEMVQRQVAESPPEQMGPPDALLRQGAILQDENDAMSVGERMLVGTGRGVDTNIRGVQSLTPGIDPPPRDPTVEAAYGDLSERYPWSTTAGEIIGEAGPFAVGAYGAQRFLERAGARLITRLGAQAGIGGAEGGTIAAGREQDVPLGAAIGAGFAVGMDLIGPYLYRAGRSLVRNIFGKEPTQPVINAAGELSDEVRRAADEAGISPDELIDEVIDLAENSARAGGVSAATGAVGQEATAQEIQSVLGAARSGSESRMAGVVDPDPAIMSAAERLGLGDQIPASAVSRSRPFQEAEQALKAYPDTGLSGAEQVFEGRLKEEADRTISMFEGTLDRGQLDAAVRQQFDETDSRLFNMADRAYDEVERAIPASSPVSTQNSESYVLGLLNDYGGPDVGERFLSAAEKKVLALAEMEGDVTYAALDRVRKDIGAAIGKKQGPFKDEEVGGLKKLYEALLEDQSGAAASYGVGDAFDAGRAITRQRKQLEDRMVELFGRNLDQTMLAKLDTGVRALSSGDMQKLKKMMDALPASRREEVAATLLNRMFTNNARSQAQLSQGFVSYYEQLNRSPKVKEFFFNYLPEQARERMDDLYAVAKGFYGAKQYENTSNTARTVMSRFESGGWVDRLYSSGKAGGAGAMFANFLGIPVDPTTAAAAAAGAQAVLGRRTTRTEAADKLLRSPKFREALKAAATDNAKSSDDAVRSTKAFREWIDLQPAGVASQVASIGLIPYLLGDGDAQTQ
jgi:hypothetical protein